MPLTPAQTATLKAAITGDAAMSAFVTARDCQAMAEIFNAKTTTAIHPRMINARQIMAELGTSVGTTILDKLVDAATVSSPVKWAMKFITGEGIDVGDPVTRIELDNMSGVVLTPEEVAAVKGLADLPASPAEVMFSVGIAITVQDVAEAMYNPDGTAK